jgi:hypothetical protein
MHRKDFLKTTVKAGGVYVHDDDRETPNILNAIYEYEDDVLVQIEIRNHYTNLEGSNIRCSMIYTDEGWVEFTGIGYRAFVLHINQAHICY